MRSPSLSSNTAVGVETGQFLVDRVDTLDVKPGVTRDVDEHRGVRRVCNDHLRELRLLAVCCPLATDTHESGRLTRAVCQPGAGALVWHLLVGRGCHLGHDSRPAGRERVTDSPLDALAVRVDEQVGGRHLREFLVDVAGHLAEPAVLPAQSAVGPDHAEQLVQRVQRLSDERLLAELALLLALLGDVVYHTPKRDDLTALLDRADGRLDGALVTVRGLYPPLAGSLFAGHPRTLDRPPHRRSVLGVVPLDARLDCRRPPSSTPRIRSVPTVQCSAPVVASICHPPR